MRSAKRLVVLPLLLEPRFGWQVPRAFRQRALVQKAKTAVFCPAVSTP
jgi:hypothetical protein